MKIYRLGMALLLVVLFGSRLHAQVLTCDAEAFKNRDETQMSREYRAAFLKSIDRTKFEQMKSSSGGGGGFSIAGIGLSANANYEEFNQKREEELARVGYQESIDEALNYVRNSFDGPGARAYQSCIQALVELQRQRGLFMWLLDASDVAVTVKIHWRPTAETPPAHVNVASDVQLTGSPTSLNAFPVIWPADTEHQFILRRFTNRELRFVVNMGGDSASVVLPRKPTLRPTSPPPQPRCDSQAMVSRGAAASHPRLTDGVVGPNAPGQNSGRPGGTFWVELAQPEWVHHVVLYPFMNGTIGSNSIIGYDSGGNATTLATFHTTSPSSAPITIYVDINKSRNIKKVEVNVTPANGQDWVAFTEIEVFVCR